MFNLNKAFLFHLFFNSYQCRDIMELADYLNNTVRCNNGDDRTIKPEILLMKGKMMGCMEGTAIFKDR